MSIIRGDATRIPLPDCSVDAVVTDPPAGIAFMSRKWDHHGTLLGFQDFMVDAASEMVRVMKPGAHALVWALPRTCHHTGMALERAGLDVRDVVTHLFGSGFPKSHNLDGEWAGWGTALKPAAEFWFLARKPLTGTVAQNVLRWGTGALNIDGTRLLTRDTDDQRRARRHGAGALGRLNDDGWEPDEDRLSDGGAGRWPPNVTMDEEAARLLDEQSGERPAGVAVRHRGVHTGGYGGGIGSLPEGTPDLGYGDTGGASRFMYVVPPDQPGEPCAVHGVKRCTICLPVRFLYAPKASRAERNAGLKGMPTKDSEHLPAKKVRECNQCGSRSRPPGPNPVWPACGHGDWTWVVANDDGHKGGRTQNHHPTVKPLALMRWLCRLVTPPGGLVLDPFLGSGTTLLACAHEGLRGIGIEREAEYVEIAKGRLSQPVQQGLL